MFAYLSGKTTKEISRDFDISRNTVISWTSKSKMAGLITKTVTQNTTTPPKTFVSAEAKVVILKDLLTKTIESLTNL